MSAAPLHDWLEQGPWIAKPETILREYFGFDREPPNLDVFALRVALLFGWPSSVRQSGAMDALYTENEREQLAEYLRVVYPDAPAAP